MPDLNDFFGVLLKFLGVPKVENFSASTNIQATISHPLMGPKPQPVSFAITGPTDKDQDGNPELNLAVTVPGMGPISVNVEVNSSISSIIVRAMTGDLGALTELLEISLKG